MSEGKKLCIIPAKYLEDKDDWLRQVRYKKQGKVGNKFLFVCGMNRNRSSVAEELIGKVTHLQVRSAGMLEGATVELSKDLIDWADFIFCMGLEHRAAVLQLIPSAASKMGVLYIPDRYLRNDPELKELIIKRMSRYLDPKLLQQIKSRPN